MNNNLIDTESYKGWNTSDHLDAFNNWNKLSNPIFNFTYGNFQENRYILDILEKGKAKNVLDIGCATGTTYRYILNKLNEKKFNYKGFDISEIAINFAKNFHKKDFFYNIQENDYRELTLKDREIIYTRDTVMHQEKPFDFLKELISLTSKFLVFRLKTRDHGKTEWDINNSKQMHYDKYWMPYIVININDLLEILLNFRKPKSIQINRSYEVLGGKNFRYLPEELYFKSSGGSETSICIEFGDNENTETKINYTEILEGRKFLDHNKTKFFMYRLLNHIIKKPKI